MSLFGAIRVIGYQPGGIEDLKFHQGKVISAGHKDIRVWDPAAGIAWAKLNDKKDLKALKGKVLRKFTPGSALALAVHGDSIFCGLKHGVVTQIDAGTGATIRDFKFECESKSRHPFDFCAVAISRDGAKVAATNRDMTLVWNVADGAVIIQEEKRGGNALHFLDNVLMVQPWDPFVYLVDTNKAGAPFFEEDRWKGMWGNLVTSRPTPKGPVPFVFSMVGTDEEDLKTTEPSGDLELDWNDEFHQAKLRGAEVKAGIEPEDPPEPDSGFFLGVVPRQNGVTWQAKTEGRIHAFEFLDDGKQILSGGNSGFLELWNVGEAKPQERLDLTDFNPGAKKARTDMISTTNTLLGSEEFYIGHTIHALAVSADGKSCAVGTAGGLVLSVGLKG